METLVIRIIENESENATVTMDSVTSSVIENGKRMKGRESWKENLKEITKGKFSDMLSFFIEKLFHSCFENIWDKLNKNLP